MKRVLPFSLLPVVAVLGCRTPDLDKGLQKAWREGAVTLFGEGGAKVVVSPALQGRVLTSRVGSIDSTGFIGYAEIQEGEDHPRFNDFGGQDRLWLGPEGGKHSLFIQPGLDLSQEIWKAPADLDRGPFPVTASLPDRVQMARALDVTNALGIRFRLTAEREIGLIPPREMERAFGIALPAGVSYTGSYSDNALVNGGPEKWSKESGMPNIWILGQFLPGPRAAVIAPFRAGEGVPYRDAGYHGTIPPDRLKVLPGEVSQKSRDEAASREEAEVSEGKRVRGPVRDRGWTGKDAILFRADGRSEGRFGIRPSRVALSPDTQRPMGIAGSFDFDRNLLIVVRFDAPPGPAEYASSHWNDRKGDFEGDLFLACCSDRSKTPDERHAWYGLESVSPSMELDPGAAVRHRQETHCFQGEYGKLRDLAGRILGVDLDKVREEFRF